MCAIRSVIERRLEYFWYCKPIWNAKEALPLAAGEVSKSPLPLQREYGPRNFWLSLENNNGEGWCVFLRVQWKNNGS